MVTELCRKHGISSPTFYKWEAKFGGMNVSEARKLRALEEENGRLKRMLADAMLDNVALKELLGKKWWRPLRIESLQHACSRPLRRASGGRAELWA